MPIKETQKPKALENKGFRRCFLASQRGFEPPTPRLGVGTGHWPHARFVPKSCYFVSLYAIFITVIVRLCDGMYDDIRGTLLASC